jgi:hypothetical protein
MRVRETLLIILAAALMVMVVADAAAQQAPVPQGAAPHGTIGRPQAPVGHRQPRISDLPPDVARREQSGQPPKPDAQDSTSGQGRQNHRSIDESLRICRGC